MVRQLLFRMAADILVAIVAVDARRITVRDAGGIGFFNVPCVDVVFIGRDRFAFGDLRAASLAVGIARISFNGTGRLASVSDLRSADVVVRGRIIVVLLHDFEAVKANLHVVTDGFAGRGNVVLKESFRMAVPQRFAGHGFGRAAIRALIFRVAGRCAVGRGARDELPVVISRLRVRRVVRADAGVLVAAKLRPLAPVVARRGDDHRRVNGSGRVRVGKVRAADRTAPAGFGTVRFAGRGDFIDLFKCVMRGEGFCLFPAADGTNAGFGAVRIAGRALSGDPIAEGAALRRVFGRSHAVSVAAYALEAVRQAVVVLSGFAGEVVTLRGVDGTRFQRCAAGKADKVAGVAFRHAGTGHRAAHFRLTLVVGGVKAGVRTGFDLRVAAQAIRVAGVALRHAGTRHNAAHFRAAFMVGGVKAGVRAVGDLRVAVKAPGIAGIAFRHTGTGHRVSDLGVGMLANILKSGSAAVANAILRICIDVSERRYGRDINILFPCFPS